MQHWVLTFTIYLEWKLNTSSFSIIPGSLSAVAAQNHKSIAETFVSADVVILIDTSGSMAERDARGGKSRYDVACEELKQLQESLPGKIALVSFSSEVSFCPAGVPTNYGSSTDLVRGLNYVKVADIPDMHFILISDGQPDNPFGALDVARTFNQKIDVIYVGPESRPEGREFLQKLAAATGGKSVMADKTNNLFNEINTLLLNAYN